MNMVHLVIMNYVVFECKYDVVQFNYIIVAKQNLLNIAAQNKNRGTQNTNKQLAVAGMQVGKDMYQVIVWEKC